MSGVFGCWHLDGRPVNAVALDTGVTCISPKGPAGSGCRIDGPVGLAHKSTDDPGLERQPASSGHAVCVFDGRIDNRADLIAGLTGAPIDANSRDEVLALEAYQRYGDACVERITGDFAFGLFDRRANRLLIARDRLGVRPLCYTQLNGTFLFASEAKALLACGGIPAAPDEVMLADFFLQFLSSDSQKRTFFRDIHSLPPAHVLIVTPAGTTIRRYFEFDTSRRIVLPTLRDYAAAFHDRFVASVRNRMRSPRPVAVSVSGGLDSAYIFCVAQDLVRRGSAPCPAVLGFNYSGVPGTPSEEDDFVRAIEQSSGATIERIPQRTGFMEHAPDEVWHAESPLVEGLARQRQAMLRAVRASGAGRLLTGHWGDQVLSDSDYLFDLCRSRRWRLLRRHAREWGIRSHQLAIGFARDLASRHLPRPLTRLARRVRRGSEGAWRSPWFTDNFRALLRQRFEDERLKRTAGTSHAWAIYQQSRGGYHVQCMEWNTRLAAMHGLEIAFPYLDCDLLEYLMGIPGDVQSHDGVPRGLMREAMRGLVPDVVVNRRTKGEFTRLANQSIDHDFAMISEILGPTALSVQCGYVNGPVLWRLLHEWRAAIRTTEDGDLADRVIDLCGLELLLRRFDRRKEAVT